MPATPADLVPAVTSYSCARNVRLLPMTIEVHAHTARTRHKHRGLAGDHAATRSVHAALVEVDVYALKLHSGPRSIKIARDR